MTTTTTVLGLAPLVLFPGAGSELYRGLGSVVLGGLIVSTIFTLVLAPTLFSLALDLKARLLGDHTLSSGDGAPAIAKPHLPTPPSNGADGAAASSPAHEYVRSSPDR
jgi:HAE1 family hydrophobic/amphiphilic exporter-1